MIWTGKQNTAVSRTLAQNISTWEIITWAVSSTPKHITVPLQTGASTVNRKKITGDVLLAALLH